MAVTLHPVIPPWLEFAELELGVQEIPGHNHNSRILEYHATTTLHATDDETSWCSSFVNWCFTQAMIRGTNSAAARSWLGWGVRLGHPAFGCVAVLRRGGNKALAYLTGEEKISGHYLKGHTGFWTGRSDGKDRLCGGNQGNMVSIANFPLEDVLGYFWPAA